MRIFGSLVELVILDVDGVILDILGGLHKNLEETAVHFGLSLDVIAQNIADIALGKLRIRGNARDSTHTLWPHLSEAEVTEFVDFFEEVERRSPYGLIPGSLEIISFLRDAGMPMALATNNHMKSLLWRLEAAGIDPSWFAAIVTKDNRYFKPHPQTFDPIFAAVPVPRDRALYVGDLQIDWDTACEAGVSFIAVLSGGVPRRAFLHEGVQADHIMNRLNNLLECMEL